MVILYVAANHFGRSFCNKHEFSASHARARAPTQISCMNVHLLQFPVSYDLASILLFYISISMDLFVISGQSFSFALIAFLLSVIQK